MKRILNLKKWTEATPWPAWCRTMVGRLPLRRMMSAVLGLMLVAAATGCRSSRVDMPATASLHPEHETRMSSHPMPGYVPTPVWRVQSGKSTLYLVGTVHLLPNSQIPFPSSLYAAYEDADKVYMEVGDKMPGGLWGTLRVPWWFVKNRRELFCPKGKTIADYVSPEIDRKLRSASGREYCTLSRFSPAGWIFVINTVGPPSEVDGVAFQGNPVTSPSAASSFKMGSGGAAKECSAVRGAAPTEGDSWVGVEDYFVARAARDRKPVRGLDDGSVLVTAFQWMDSALSDAKLKVAVSGADAALLELFAPNEVLSGNVDASVAQDASDELVSWRIGDLTREEQELTELRKELEATPGLYDKLLPERNRAWMKKIKPLLRGRKKTVVMVGISHLPGDSGILQLLRDAGYDPVQMYGVDLRAPVVFEK